MANEGFSVSEWLCAKQGVNAKATRCNARARSLLIALGQMKPLHALIRKFDKGRSDFATAVELAASALLLALTLRMLTTW